MQITPEILTTICNVSSSTRFSKFIKPLNETMDRYSINSKLRAAAFLAQVAHESGNFLFVRELASGKAYEGRKDLGNTEPGDGVKYKGRGLIQITGKANYSACGDALNIDLISTPGKLEEPLYACLSAGWFWDTHSLNELADDEKFKTITRRINGGLNGYDDRLMKYNRALKVLDGE